jgi:hypothetical protein
MTSTRLIGAMRLLCCIAVAAAAAAGCTSSSGDNAGPALPVNVTGPGTTAGSAGAAGSAGPAGGNSAAAVWREFVTCARQNGQQNMPDPVVNNDGTAQFPPAQGFNEKNAYRAVRASCGAILNRLPARANPLARPSVTPEQMQVLRRYVQCLRDNGLPDMPDPGPNGEIADPPGAGPDGPRRQARDAARNACDRILLDDFQ